MDGDIFFATSSDTSQEPIVGIDVDIMREKGCVPKDAGYQFTTLEEESFVEFHVDDCQSFSKSLNKSTEFGGNKSSLFINAPTSTVHQWEMNGMFEEENDPSNVGYEYLSLVGVPMTEVHALHFKDDAQIRNNLKKTMVNNKLFFCVSVRPALLLFGQDEVIFKQFIMTLKVWLGRGGKQPLRPKYDGMGLLASAFRGRDRGFAMKLTDQ